MISVNTDKDIKYFQNKAILNFGDELKDFEGDYDLPYMFFGGFARE